jgi:hypothetical protein
MSTSLKIAIAIAVVTGLGISMQQTVVAAGTTTWGCIKNPACLYNTPPKPPVLDEGNKNQG